MTLKEWALAYVHNFNWAIIPIHGKSPVIKTWLEFQKRVPTNQEIEEWFKLYEKNITGLAVITGSVSNLSVIDFDLEKDDKENPIPGTLNPIIKTLTKGSGSLVVPSITFPVILPLWANKGLRNNMLKSSKFKKNSKSLFI